MRTQERCVRICSTCGGANVDDAVAETGGLICAYLEGDDKPCDGVPIDLTGRKAAR